VSVLVPVFNDRTHVVAALDSVRVGRFRDVELIVLDDGSSDGSADAAAAWGDAHPDVALLVARHTRNRGLPGARNSALALSRGDLAFALDADNLVFPHALERLVEALDDEPGCDFAYGIVQRFDEDGAQGLLSMFPWEPDRLRIGNYIDAMALFRTATLRRIGGYADAEPFTHGWEDYELWCRMAALRLRGAFVPEILGRYRVQPGSLLSRTNLRLAELRSALEDRYPHVMGSPAP
jgi:glycosyltransferase involved in cell wall biosynthesis